MTVFNSPLSAALQVVARHREHGAYDSHANVLKAIRRRVAHIGHDEAEHWLYRATTLYDAATHVAANNVAALWAARTGNRLAVPDDVRSQLASLVPNESDEDYDETLSWVFYVNHLR